MDKLDRYLVIVRHGEYRGGDSSPLSETGCKQMQSLRFVINGFVAKTLKRGETNQIFISFSGLPRAIESVQKLKSNEDFIVTSLYITERSDIRKPRDILDKVLALADHYRADGVIIVAHGDMPAVITETAYELATGKKHEELPYTREACGYITNMSTGEVVPIRHNDLDAKPVPPLTVQDSGRPVFKGGPLRTDQVVVRGGPRKISTRPIDNDDDIPF